MRVHSKNFILRRPTNYLYEAILEKKKTAFMLLSKFSIQRRQQDLSLCNSGLDEDQIHQERREAKKKKKKQSQRLKPRKLMFQLGGPHMKGTFEKKNFFDFF